MTTLAQNNRSTESALGSTQPGVSNAVQRLLQAWHQHRIGVNDRRKAARADQQLWNAALADSRIMADITRAQHDQPGEVRKRRMMRLF